MVKKLSYNDMRIMVMALQCLKQEVNIDFDELAEMAGYKTRKVAHDSWHRVKLKLAAGAVPPAAPKKKKRATKVEVEGAGAGEGEGEDEGEWEEEE